MSGSQQASDKMKQEINEEERRKILRETDLETHDAIMALNFNMQHVIVLITENTEHQKQQTVTINELCQKNALLENRMANVEKEHVCPFHQDMGERMVAVEQRQEATDKKILETIKPQLDTLFKDRWAMMVLVVVTLIGLVELLAKGALAK